MDKARVGDVNICYRLAGEGPPLVSIMGFTATMDMWSPQLVEGLSAAHRFLIFDNRGTGRSTSGDKGLSTIPMAGSFTHNKVSCPLDVREKEN